MDAYYLQEYRERWPALKEALKEESAKSCLVNKFADGIEGLEGLELSSVELNGLICLLLPKGQVFPKPQRDINSLCYYYLLDIASVLPTIALQLESHHTVLDMCASPGGKSVAIAQQLFMNSKNTKAHLQLNEISNERRIRLLKTVKSYIPSHLRSNINVTGLDGTKSPFYQDFYDRILIDAPCSTDRHVLQTGDSKWSPSRLKTDQTRQLKLLSSGWNALKTNGILVYATCSLSQIENDNVVQKAIKKHGFTLIKQTFSIGEPTEFGWLLLPDTSGWGPLYFSILQK